MALTNNTQCTSHLKLWPGLNYTTQNLKKIAYAVIMASRKLRHYFEAHRIIAISDQPLHDLLHNREASPRIAKWAFELSELVVDFEKRTTIKSQVLADFIVDWTSPEAQEEELIETWTVYCDEA